MRKISHIISFILFASSLLTSINAKAGDYKLENLKYSYSGYYGKYIARPPDMLPFDQTPYFGQELRVGIKTDGAQYWHKALNFPYYGLGLYNGNFLDNYKGALYGGFAFIDIPVLVVGKSKIETSLALGFVRNCNNFDISNNTNFMENSSYANAYSHIGLNYSFQLNNKFSLGCGVRFQHFSNGGWQYPNNGLEMTSGEVKIQYTPKPLIQKTDVANPEQKYNKRVAICYAAGVSGSDIDPEAKYFNTTLSATYAIINNTCYLLSGGLDLQYTGYVIEDQSPTGSDNSQVFSNGIFVSNELVAGKCRFGIQVGTRLYNHQSFISPIYERLILRYQVLDNSFLHFGIKLNGQNSEFFEWGFGINL